MATIIELSDTEKEKIATNKKPELPTYFSEKIGKEVTISPDFEKFMILMDDATRTEITTWFVTAATIAATNVTIDRNFLLSDYINRENTVAFDQLTEINVRFMQAYNVFRSKIATMKFSDATEVSLLLADIQLPLDELSDKQDKYLHDYNYSSLMKSIKGALLPSDNRLKQIKSWSDILLGYGL